MPQQKHCGRERCLIMVKRKDLSEDSGRDATEESRFHDREISEESEIRGRLFIE